MYATRGVELGLLPPEHPPGLGSAALALSPSIRPGDDRRHGATIGATIGAWARAASIRRSPSASASMCAFFHDRPSVVSFCVKVGSSNVVVVSLMNEDLET